MIGLWVMQASFNARGWRAEVIMALVVGLVAIGAATVTWWAGTLAGDLAWRLGSSCGASRIVDAVTSGAVAFVPIVAMIKLGRWSRTAVPGVLADDEAGR